MFVKMKMGFSEYNDNDPLKGKNTFGRLYGLKINFGK